MTKREMKTASIESLTARETVLRGVILACYAPGRELGDWLADTTRRDELANEWRALKAELAYRLEEVH